MTIRSLEGCGLLLALCAPPRNTPLAGKRTGIFVILALAQAIQASFSRGPGKQKSDGQGYGRRFHFIH
jgi:hypothetical protein